MNFIVKHFFTVGILLLNSFIFFPLFKATILFSDKAKNFINILIIEEIIVE